MSIVAIVGPALVALVGGGAVGIWLARPQREGIISEAAEHAVLSIETSMARMEDTITDQDARISQLEADLGIEMAKVSALAREVRRLGGNPTTILKGGLNA